MTTIADVLTNNLDVWITAIERKSFGRGGSKKLGLYGIDKLRVLILHLAVRGELAQQVRGEKIDADLIGLIKLREKASSTRADRNALSIPANWIHTRFGDVFELEYGANLPDKARSQTGEFPVFGSNGLVGTHDAALVHSPCIVVGRKGSAGAVNLCLDLGCWVTDVAYYCVPPRGLDIRFAGILFRTLGLDGLGKGIKPGLNRNEAYAIEISLPPLPEQQRIVAKVDELTALCDALEKRTYESLDAHELLVETLLATLTNSEDEEELARNWTRVEANFDTLFTTTASIDQLKQTILQLAVMGKLVCRSRTDDRSNQDQLRPDNNAEAYDLKSFSVRAMKFPLPSHWTIEPLSRVCGHIVDCPHTTPKWTDEGYLCAKSEQIMAGYLDLTNPNYVSEETYIERIQRLKPEPNDILFKREGGILGVACRIPEGLELCLGQRLMLIRTNKSMSSAFLELVLNSPWITDYAAEKTTGGAAPRVNMAVVRGFPIPVPPTAEQHRILEKYAALSDLCDLLKSKLSTARADEVVLADAVASKVMV